MCAARRLAVVDLSQPERAVASAIDQACRDLGFFLLVNHAVAEALIERAYGESLAFFDRPLAQKLSVARPRDGSSRGYNRLADAHHAATFRETAGAPPVPGDLQESFAIGTHDNLWPASSPDFVGTISAYYEAMARLAARLLSHFASALDLDSGFFADKIDRHASILRLTHYPEQGEAPVSGQLRSGAHTDFGTLTILRTDDAPGGLQVRDRDRSWIDVRAPRGAFVINVGDLLARWTNDRWVSSIHRVINPPREQAHRRRLSLVFFHEPNPETVVHCLSSCTSEANPPRYPDIAALDHRRMRVAALRGPAISEAARG